MTGAYTLRHAYEADIPAVLAVYGALIGTEGCTWSSEYPNIEHVHTDIGQNALYCLCDKNGGIVAVASAGAFGELDNLEWPSSAQHACELARIGVIPSMQKKGIGFMFLNMLMEELKQRGYDAMRLLVSKHNPAALTLYHKTGFSQCGEVFMYDIDFYFCERRLETA